MSDTTDRALALIELLRLAQPTVEPTLTTGASSEVESILDKSKRASTWTPGSYFAPGQMALPTARNGHRYRCRQGGVSDNTVQTQVISVTVTNGGTGYTSAPSVAFSGGGGSGASGVALISGGLVVGVFLTSPGTGYTSAPTVALTGGGGSSAAATASINGSEPVWPTTQGARTSDGTSDPQLIWEEFGPDFDNIYDVRAAAHACWMLKAEKASSNFNLKLGGLGFDREQIYKHCLEMAAKFTPYDFA